MGLGIDTAYRLIGESSQRTGNYPDYVREIINNIVSWIGASETAELADVTKKVVILILIIGLLRSISSVYPRIRMLINYRLGMDIRKNYFSKIIEKGYKFFNRFRTGDLVTRLTDDIDGSPKIAWFACSGIFRAAESSSKFIFCIVFMLFMNWKLTLLSIAPFPVMLFIFYRLKSRLTEISLMRQQRISATNDALEAGYSGIRILKAFNAQDGQSESFRNILSSRVDVELKFQRLTYLINFAYQAINSSGQLIVIVVGGWMVINDLLSFGEFYAFYVYLSLLLDPLIDIPNLFVSSRTAFACIDRLNEIETTSGGTEGYHDGSTALPELTGVKIEGASFSYLGSNHTALDGINLSIKRGQKVAVVGAVGSGKSTLIKLAAGLYPPAEGQVSFNDIPVTEIEVVKLRESIGYIPQESTLFSESISDNVTFGRDISEEMVTGSLELAQIRSEVEAFPDRYDTVLGQKGLTVSGGQKQRMAIARAIAGSPDILLMDDCTASLDAENEQKFWENFDSRYPDTACLIVTHRLATARRADIVYVLDHGRIAGMGSHSELVDSCEPYRNFLTRDELRAALSGNQDKIRN